MSSPTLLKKGDRTAGASAGDDWYKQNVTEVLGALGSDASIGLAPADAAEKLRRHGPNELADHGGRTVWQILWEQVSSVLILILIVAAGLAAFLGKPVDAIAIPPSSCCSWFWVWSRSTGRRKRLRR